MENQKNWKGETPSKGYVPNQKSADSKQFDKSLDKNADKGSKTDGSQQRGRI